MTPQYHILGVNGTTDLRVYDELQSGWPYVDIGIGSPGDGKDFPDLPIVQLDAASLDGLIALLCAIRTQHAASRSSR